MPPRPRTRQYRRTARRLVAAALSAWTLAACSPAAPTAGRIESSTVFSTQSASPVKPCDVTCRNRRLELKYVVRMGKQVYAYWDEKRAETGTDFDRLAAGLESMITSDTTATQYYRILKAWAAAFHDGHVDVAAKPYDAEIEVFTSPVRLELLSPGTDHEKLIVASVPEASALNSSELKRGDEVLAINGVEASRALDEAELVVGASTRRSRRYWAAMELVDALGSDEGSLDLTLTVRPFRKEGEAPAPSREVRLYRDAELVERAGTNGQVESTGARNLRALVLPGGIGYLRIDAFEGSQISFLIEQAMSRLKGTRGLLIDVRRNSGGDQSGNLILARLSSAAVIRYRASERLSERLLAQWTEAILPFWAEGEEFAAWRDVKVSPADRAHQYGDNKPVFVLTGARCFSACDTFVSALQANRLATIVGEGTGGGTGTPIQFELPFSKHDFRYSVTRGQTVRGEPIEGVGTMPDIVIEPTQADRAEERDRQLLKAIGLLEQEITARTAPLPAPELGEPARVHGPQGKTASDAALEQAWESALAETSRELGSAWRQDLDLSPTRASEREKRRFSGIDEL